MSDSATVVGWLLVGAAVVTGLVLAFLIERRQRRQAAQFDAMCAAAGQWVPLAARTARVTEGETAVDGRPVRLEIQRGALDHPAYVRLRVPVDLHAAGPGGAYRRPPAKPIATAATAVLRRKTSVDRAGEKTGLTRLRRTGDAALDARVHIDTDAPAETIALLFADPAALDALARLFDAGLDRVQILEGSPEITAVFRAPDPARIAAIPKVARDLARLADALPELTPGAVGRSGSLRRAILPLVLAGTGALGFTAAVLSDSSMPIVDPEALGLLVDAGILAWIPLCAVLYLALRGRCRSLYDDVYAELALLAATLGLALGGMALNTVLDDGPVRPHVVRVLRVTTTTETTPWPRTRRQRHSATLESWRPDRRDIDVFDVGSGASLLVHGRRVKVLTRPGRFGWEWISGLEPVVEAEPAGAPSD